MVQKQVQSVGDVAHLLEVHEQVVIEWAERNELPRGGREFVLSPRDVRELERWLNAAGTTEEDTEGDDDDGDPEDADDGAGDDDEGEEDDDDDGDFGEDEEG